MSKFSKSKTVMPKAEPVKVLQSNISSQDLLELWNSVPTEEIFRELQVNRPSLVWLLYIKAGCRTPLDSYYKSFVQWSSLMLNYLSFLKKNYPNQGHKISCTWTLPICPKL
jgi:hypothetical protein